MSPKTLLPQVLTSTTLRTLNRGLRGLARRLSGRRPVLHGFIERDEPYSSLLIQALPRIAARYGAVIAWHEVGAPDASAAPEPEKLADWAREDAADLAQTYGLSAGPVEFPEASPIAEGEALRRKWGHYGSGMTWFEGEWYWGLDRLHYLETRLGGQDLLFAPEAEPDHTPGGEIEVFLSLRSPYSYIAVMRMFALAERWGATLQLRPVLPMVMRALPVPWSKRFYIVRDCKREAERFGLEFGKIADPVGPGVERGLAILNREIAAGRGQAFLQAYMHAVWTEGIDPAGDAGLQKICQRAGIGWTEASKALDDESWREMVEANRRDLFAHGHWGVPAFKVGDRMAFGQDRLARVGRWLGD